jgi:hypothetical protein
VGEKENNARYMKERKRSKMMKIRKREMEWKVRDEEEEKEDDGRRKARKSG